MGKLYVFLVIETLVFMTCATIGALGGIVVIELTDPFGNLPVREHASAGFFTALIITAGLLILPLFLSIWSAGFFSSRLKAGVFIIWLAALIGGPLSAAVTPFLYRAFPAVYQGTSGYIVIVMAAGPPGLVGLFQIIRVYQKERERRASETSHEIRGSIV